MPRKPIIRSHEHFYHVSARSNNKEYFFLPTSDIWVILSTELAKLQTEFGLKIGAFVLMNNHFHLLILTPRIDIDRVMYFLMKKTTLHIQRRSGRINKIFGGRYKGSLIENEHYLINAFKYIYRNPIEGNLSKSAEAYAYTTLNKKIIFPFVIDEVLPFSGPRVLEWINQKFKEEDADSIRHGLKRAMFAYKKSRITRDYIQPKIDFITQN